MLMNKTEDSCSWLSLHLYRATYLITVTGSTARKASVACHNKGLEEAGVLDMGSGSIVIPDEDPFQSI